MALTVKRVARLRSAGTPGKYLDHGSAEAVRGLHLVVENERNASWQLRYQLHGRTRWMGLGSARDVPLDKAREKAKAARLQLSEKTDPLEARRAERAEEAAKKLGTVTFAEAAQAFHDQNKAGWKNQKHAAQVIQTLKTYAFPALGRLPVQVISTPQVLQVLRSIWTTKPETAMRVRGRIEAVLAWSQVNGYRSGDNPARWTNHLDKALPKRSAVAKVQHHAALDYRAIPPFMTALKQREGMAAKALAFTVLTAARTGEVIGATWNEFDLDEKVWTVPASRMKAGAEHRVPLSDAVIDLLRRLPRDDANGHVFIGGRQAALSNMAMSQLLKRMGHGDITTHGMRSAFRTWAAERTNFPHEVAEAALAHTVSDKVVRAYRRGDFFARRRALMEAWSRFASSPPATNGNGEVVALRERRR